jgi:hypothetical protein
MNGNSEPKLGGYEYVLFLGIVIRHRAAWGNPRMLASEPRACELLK